MGAVTDHPLRYPLTNELHARPFPAMSAPGTVVFLALKGPDHASAGDRESNRAQLVSLLDRHGMPHPQPGATHYSTELGRHRLKWEQHSEFVTYTVFTPSLADRPFDAADFGVFPEDWLGTLTGVRITSATLRVEVREHDARVLDRIRAWFVPESVAVSRVLGDAAVVAGDFRIDEAGHQRFALFVSPGTGERRVGRIIQRLLEIQTYQAMSMLGFAMVRSMAERLSELDVELAELMRSATEDAVRSEDTLHALLRVSAELESASADASFRFGATQAYEAIVSQRIEVLREASFDGRQTFSEFMRRRYEPAMRTVRSTERRLESMANRAMRAGDLLQTRVEVERSRQNQSLLASMNRRARLQLRLQHTVEGLSVVAVSYYAISIGGYLAYPLTDLLGVSKGTLTAALALPTVGGVWWLLRRLRAQLH